VVSDGGTSNVSEPESLRKTHLDSKQTNNLPRAQSIPQQQFNKPQSEKPACALYCAPPAIPLSSTYLYGHFKLTILSLLTIT